MARVDLIQVRHGTAAEWTAVNPILAMGEPGAEDDTGLMKVGDGTTAWNLLSYANTGFSVEQVQDIVAAFLLGGAGVTLTYDDAGNVDTIVIANGAVTNAMLAGAIALSKLATDPLARANHTGTQISTTISDLTEAVQDIIGAFLSDTTEFDYTYDDAGNAESVSIKVGSVALSKLATDPLARANHTGTQTSGTISDFAEAAQDAIAALIVAGSGITATYNDAANTLTLTASGGTPAFSGVRVRNSTDQNVATATFTLLTFDTNVIISAAGYHSTVTNTSRLVAQTTGKHKIYFLDTATEVSATTGVQRKVGLFVNGTNVLDIMGGCGPRVGVYLPFNGSVTLDLTAGDYVEVKGYQDSGATMAYVGHAAVSNFPCFGMEYIAA